MKVVDDARLIARLAAPQRGVFSKPDLKSALAEPHAAALTRRIRALEEVGALRRFCRGWYVAETFELPTLSQRLAPRSYISFAHVLAKELLIGTRPSRQIMAAKFGKARTYEGLGSEVVHVHLADHLDFGYASEDGVQYADAEKAMLDVLYFHLRGRRFPFDVYSDVDHTRLDRRRLRAYLRRYRNPKFVGFVSNLLELE